MSEAKPRRRGVAFTGGLLGSTYMMLALALDGVPQEDGAIAGKLAAGGGLFIAAGLALAVRREGAGRALACLFAGVATPPALAAATPHAFTLALDTYDRLKNNGAGNLPAIHHAVDAKEKAFYDAGRPDIFMLSPAYSNG